MSDLLEGIEIGDIISVDLENGGSTAGELTKTFNFGFAVATKTGKRAVGGKEQKKVTTYHFDQVKSVAKLS